MFVTGERDEEARRRISQISTHWSALQLPSTEVVRYAGPVFRYFLGIVRQPSQAEELAMQFVQRFMMQDVQRHAQPEAGRFRDYLKASLRNMVQDVWRQTAKDKKFYGTLPSDAVEGSESDSAGRADVDDFDTQCHVERIDAAWERLRRDEVNGVEPGDVDAEGTPYYSALRLQAEHNEMSAQQIAEALNRNRRSPLRPENVRQILTRSRRRFGEYLLDEVLKSLPAAEHDDIERELIELKLLPYCKSALRERQNLRHGHA